MNIMMICGSPRPKNSNSMYLLHSLKGMLEKENNLSIYDASGKNAAALIASNLSGMDALVIAFPLYVDSIPSHLLDVLSAIEKTNISKKETIMVYTIVNNGFYDAIQNGIAIDSIWSWCQKSGLKKGYAIGAGAGEMAQMAPLGHGPSTNLGNAMNQLAKDIKNKESGKTVFVEPNFPRFLYKAAAHSQWRKQAGRNGLKPSDIRRT